MNLLNKLEKNWGRFAIPNLAIYLVGGQACMFILIALQRISFSDLAFVPSLVMEGQLHRLFSFVLMPFSASWFSCAIALWIFYMLSNALEQTWGTFKFNLFILSGVLINIVVGMVMAFVFPYITISSYFIYLTVFFAFATLYPNHEFLLFFILPVKVKYLAMLSAGVFVVLPIFTAGWGVKISALASVSNYLIFFGPQVVRSLYFRKRRSDFHSKQEAVREEAFHTCSVCGATDKSHPQRDFRYRDGKGICSVCIEAENRKD